MRPLPYVGSDGTKKNVRRAWPVAWVENRTGISLLGRLSPRIQAHSSYAPSHQRIHCRIVHPQIPHGRVDMSVARESRPVPAAVLGAVDPSLHARQNAAYVLFPLAAADAGGSDQRAGDIHRLQLNLREMDPAAQDLGPDIHDLGSVAGNLGLAVHAWEPAVHILH